MEVYRPSTLQLRILYCPGVPFRRNSPRSWNEILVLIHLPPFLTKFIPGKADLVNYFLPFMTASKLPICPPDSLRRVSISCLRQSHVRHVEWASSVLIFRPPSLRKPLALVVPRAVSILKNHQAPCPCTVALHGSC